MTQANTESIDIHQCAELTSSAGLEQQIENSCEITQNLNQCDGKKRATTEHSPELSTYFETCKKVDKTSDVIEATLTCAPLTVIAGARIIPAGLSKVSLPTAWTPAFAKLGSWLLPVATVAGTAASVYTVASFGAEAIEADKACFKNFELKKSFLLLEQKKALYLQQKLENLIPPSEQRRLIFPPAYLNDDFIKNLDCTRMRQIGREQSRKQDEILGPLIAAKSLTVDPRGALPVSAEEQVQIDQLKSLAPCLSKAKQAAVACAIAQLIVSGKSLPSDLQKLNHSPVAKLELSTEQAAKKLSTSNSSQSNAISSFRSQPNPKADTLSTGTTNNSLIVPKTVTFKLCNPEPCKEAAIKYDNRLINHEKEHVLDPLKNKEFVDNVNQFLKQNPKASEDEIKVFLSKLSKDENAPIRNGKGTTFFAQEIDVSKMDDLLKSLSTTKLHYLETRIDTIKKSEGSKVQLPNAGTPTVREFYNTEKINGVQYQVVICRKGPCSRGGDKLEEGDILTFFPVCGDNVKKLPSHKAAASMLASREAKNAQELFTDVKCPD